jgi:short-subunit dehydrogenase
MNLEGAKVIVTGAASGIGRALLHELAQFQVRGLAVDRDAAGLRTALAAAPGSDRWQACTCDLGSDAGVDTVLARVADLGGVDVFFANAGFAYYERFGATDWAHAEAIFRVNVLSPLVTLARLEARAGGRPFTFVITGSSMGRLGLPGYALYSATKAAIDQFGAALEFEGGRAGRLMVVYPIATRTSFFAAAGAAEPIPWPSQTAQEVARATIRGVQRDARRVFPSRLFRLLEVLARPLLRLYQWHQARRFHAWDTTRPAALPRAEAEDAGD